MLLIHILGWSNVSVGIVFILLGIPLAKDKVPPNDFYGARFAKSLESTENWYKINRYSGRQMMVWSIPIVLLGLLGVFWRGSAGWWLIWLEGLTPLLILGGLVQTVLYARRL